jgi:hypothetical protein
LALVTTLGYPVEDIAVVGLLVGAGSVLGWRLGRGDRTHRRLRNERP